MADSSNGGAAPASGGPQNINVVTQYLKDLSFENPGAPRTLMNPAKAPSINVGINVTPKPIPGAPTDIEVELAIEARAVDGQTTLFVAEVVYAGVFRLQNFPQEMVQPVIMIECPRLLFPFARQVLADASRNGGFPPLFLEPFDFVGLYRQRLAAAAVNLQPPPGNLA